MRSITINTLVSRGATFVVCALFGSVVGWVVSALVLQFSALSGNWWFLGFIVPALLAGEWLYRKQPQLPVGSKGILKFFDERWTWIKFTEGSHGLLPGMSIEPTSVQLKTTEPRKVEALSKDNVKMTGFFFMTYYVDDMVANQNADQPLRSLEQKGDSKFRDGIGSDQSEKLEEPETWSALGRSITASIADDARLLGYKVVASEVVEILPPDEIAIANARLRVEMAHTAYESVELKAVQNWIDELGAKGIKPELALEVMQTERDKAKAERKIYRIEGAQGIADVLAAAAAKLAEAIATKK